MLKLLERLIDLVDSVMTLAAILPHGDIKATGALVRKDRHREKGQDIHLGGRSNQSVYAPAGRHLVLSLLVSRIPSI